MALEKERLLPRDSYDRFRSALSTCVFQYRADLVDDTTRFESIATANASVTRDADAGFHTLSVTATSARAVRQSRVTMPSCTGSSRVTFIGLTPLVTSFSASNYTVRAGLFDNSADKTTGPISGDGYFAQFAGGAWSIGRRSSSASGGAQVDTIVSQTSWNNDTLNGSGPSGYTLSSTAMTTVVIEESPSGVGGDRVGFVVDGLIVWAHTFAVTAQQRPSLKLSRLPIRYEITCTGAGVTAQTASVLQMGCACFVDFLAPPRPFSLTRSTLVRLFSTDTPVVSIRAAAASCRLGLRNVRATVRPFPVDTPIIVRVVTNGTLTGSTFATTSPSPSILVDTAATAVSGSPVDYRDADYGCTIAGSPDTLTVVARVLTGGSVDAIVLLEWTEEL